MCRGSFIMALITALRFSPSSGALAIDQESWFLRRRKTFFTDCLYQMLPESLTDRGIDLMYAGIGSPSFHYEVVTHCREQISEKYADNGQIERLLAAPRPIFSLSREVLHCFQQTSRTRVDNRLDFLYGFKSSDFVQGHFDFKEGSQSQQIPIQQDVVKKRAEQILTGKESMGYGDLTVPNVACLAGIDPTLGFSGFTIKEKDGVLSFHSCGFEALGSGRYAAASEFAGFLNGLCLDDRREGCGFINGLIALCSAQIKACATYGQVGGTMRLVILDGAGKNSSEQLKFISGQKALLLTEMVKTYLFGMIEREKLEKLIVELLDSDSVDAVEDRFFSSVKDFSMVEKMLRGYKTGTTGLARSSALRNVYNPSSIDLIQLKAAEGKSS